MMKRKYSIIFSQPTITQQHSKDEVDINKIMARYIKTGVLDHVTKYQPQYLDNTDTDYQESRNIIIKADEMFAELPSTVRKEFNNSPSEFLKFVNDPENHEELADLVKPKPIQTPPENPSEPKPEQVNPAPAATTP